MADVSAALLPSVAPAGLPDDYQHIRADSSAFGGEIAKGTEKLGAGFDKASDNFFSINQFYGKVAVDDQINQVMTGSDRIRRGDPSRSVPGPDGQSSPDVGYMGLQGRAALEARQPTEQALDSLIEGARKNLKSPQEQLEFDTQTRRMRSLWINEISGHANTQFKTWTAGVNDSSAAHALNGFAANLDNPEAMASHARDFIDFKVRNAQLKFGDDPAIVGQTVAAAKQELLKAQVAAKEVNDPVGALRILDKNREVAGADYPALAERLRGRVEQQDGIARADGDIARRLARPYASMSNPAYAAAASAAPGGMSATGLARTVQIESSGDPNAGAGGAHVGLGQFSPDTALEVGVANRNDPEQSVAGIARYAAKNAPVLQKVLGRAPSDAELYLAHQQGAGGASKLLANPDARAGDLVGDAAIRQNGGDPDAPARAFTALWKQKFDKASVASGEMGNGAQIAHLEGEIKSAILDDPEMTARPQAQNAALARVGAVFAAKRLQASQDDSAFKLQVANSTAEALQTGAVQNPLPKAQFIASYGAAEGERAYADYQANIQLGGDLKATASMSPQQLEALRERYAPQPGADFITQGKRADALEAAIDKNKEVRKKDPAAFLIQRTDEGGEGWRQFQATVTDPKSTPAQRTVAAALWSEKALAEQARLGVPADARRVVPESYTDALAAKLTSPELHGGTATVSDVIDAEARLWGPQHWPDVLRGLNPKISPLARVLGAGIQPQAAQQLVDVAVLSQAQVQKEEDTDKSTVIKKAVLDTFKPLAVSMVGHDGAISLFKDFQNQAEKLATLFVIQGDTASAAATKAWSQMVGFKYDFNGTIRVPKDLNLQMSEVIMGANHFQTEIGKGFSDSLDEAKKTLRLTPQEEKLYQVHLSNLKGPGGVDNPDGSRSTLKNITIESDGKTYVLPTVYDGKIVSNEESWQRAKGHLNDFPSYGSEAEASARYDKMHEFMDRDTGQFLDRRSGRKGFDIAPMNSRFEGIPEYVQRETLRAIDRDGKWVAADKEQGLMLTYGGTAVLQRNGQTIVIPWGDLALKGRAALARANTLSGVQP